LREVDNVKRPGLSVRPAPILLVTVNPYTIGFNASLAAACWGRTAMASF